tara:strand:- start:3953 stop:4726 length:774 start_codon:yes stop_codon:yes gene_type:complete
MSFLPQVKMDFIPSDEEDANDNINDEMDDFDEDKDTNVDDTNVDETKEVLDEIVPKAKSKRDDMNVNEIFNMPANEVAQGENHSPINAQGTESVAPLENVKLTKKGKPRKKRPPMTEEHKEKLKAARVKAMAARKAKAVERKESKALEKEEKELLKKQKVKRVRALKEEVEDDVEPKPIKDIANEVAQRVKEQTFTKQDLEDAQLNAIMNYEKIRKSRKEKKKVDQEKNKEQEAIRNQLRRAVAPPQEEYNPFNGCY